MIGTCYFVTFYPNAHAGETDAGPFERDVTEKLASGDPRLTFSIFDSGFAGALGWPFCLDLSKEASADSAMRSAKATFLET